jgi:hypothetical protein
MTSSSELGNDTGASAGAGTTEEAPRRAGVADLELPPPP